MYTIVIRLTAYRIQFRNLRVKLPLPLEYTISALMFCGIELENVKLILN